MVVTLTKANFEEEVNKSNVPVLVDYWASWCGPCRMVSPIIDELAEDYAGKIKVGKVNIDEESELATAAGIVSIPTVMIYQNGSMKEKLVGAYAKDNYEDVIEKYL